MQNSAYNSSDKWTQCQENLVEPISFDISRFSQIVLRSRMHNRNDNVREFEKYAIQVGRRRLYSKTGGLVSVRFVTGLTILAQNIKVSVWCRGGTVNVLPCFTRSRDTFKMSFQPQLRLYFSAVKSQVWTEFLILFFRGGEASGYARWRQKELEPCNFGE